MTPQRLAALHERCFVTPRPWSAAEFAGMLAGAHVFALGDDETGFALGRAIAGEAELLTLAVAPEARGRGLGRSLLREFLATARRQGAHAAFLEVAADNQPARALYTSEGFRAAGRRRGYFRRPDGTAADAIVMTRPIAAG